MNEKADSLHTIERSGLESTQCGESSTDASLDVACPRGPQDCPIFETVEALRVRCDELAEASHRDPLTGLYNFRFLVATLENEMERVRRYPSP